MFTEFYRRIRSLTAAAVVQGRSGRGPMVALGRSEPVDEDVDAPATPEPDPESWRTARR